MERFEGVKITWYGHDAFKLESPKGKIILVDPWLDNPLAPEGVKENMGKVDLILVTHGHSDHIGNTVEIAKNTGALVACIYEISLYLNSRGVEKVQPMNKGGSFTYDDIVITMVDATHSSGIDVGGKIVPGGEAAGFIITFENGFKVYHTGDTGLTGFMKIVGEFYKPDLLLIPVGDLFTLGPEGAAFAVKMIKPSWIIPMHYKTFPPLTGNPQKFIDYLDPEYKERVIVLNPGETAI
jgi:L-ascorbate metabolism protein UlaG (beta-lactamase superfamily)